MAFVAPLFVDPAYRRLRPLSTCESRPSIARPRPNVICAPFVACSESPKPRYKGSFSSERDVSASADPPSSTASSADPDVTVSSSLESTGQPVAPINGVDRSAGKAEVEESESEPVLALQSKKPFWRRVLEDDDFEDLRYFGVSFAIALVFRALVLEPRFIPSESMVPTFEVGDQLLIEKVSKWIRPVRPGDVVVFQPPPALTQRGYSRSDAFIKRVVGSEGDTVRVHAGRVERNGVVVEESFIAENPKYEWGPGTVPRGYVMVLGDNRNNSYDSHVWGFLPKSNIIGRAILRYWPLSRVGSVVLPPIPNATSRPNVAPALE